MNQGVINGTGNASTAKEAAWSVSIRGWPDGCMLHSHYLRGQGNMALKIIISMTVMLAAANVAIESRPPEQVRLLTKALAA